MPIGFSNTASGYKGSPLVPFFSGALHAIVESPKSMAGQDFFWG
jgi:hypothetical protein